MGRTLIILTYNELEGVKSLFDKIPIEKVDEYFVIDGNSKDGTLEYLKERRIPVIIQDEPGRGVAFKIGVENAKNNNVVFFSPDGNESPEDIEKIFQLLEEGYDLVIASRFLPGARNEEDDSLFPIRAWVNKIFTLIANLLWNRGKYITDTINGYRGIKKDVFKILNLDAKGFTIEYQMTIRAMKLKLKIIEIPTYEGNRIGGKTKAKSIPTGITFVKMLIKEIFIGNKFYS